MAKFLVTSFGELGDDLCRACGLTPEYVSRIVLDLKVGSPGRVYFETFADDETLNVRVPAGGFEVEGA